MAEAPVVAVVLAAGKGTRMRSERPKVLHEAAGRPLLAWVLDAARSAGCRRLAVVVGHQAERVRRAFAGDDGVEWVLQERQLGTGHALAQVEPHLEDLVGSGTGTIPEDALLLVLNGDVPLVAPETLRRLVEAARSHWGALAVAELDEPGRLGRVVPRRNDPDRLERIVEAADASGEELAIRTVNAGLYALPAEIFSYLARLDPDNAQGEMYLTDALVAAADDGRAVHLLRLDDPAEALGVNTWEELARVDEVLRTRG
ncbi:MAG: NTP transferase domain-containing protein [Thermoanaerobaculia bacterium]